MGIRGYFKGLRIIKMIKYLLGLGLLIVLVTAGYDTKLSKELAYMSDVAFDPINLIDSWSCSSCKHYSLTDVKAFTNSSLKMQGFVGYSADNRAVIVSFRGSSNIKNWIDDFDFIQIPYTKCSGCLMHNGFYLGYLTIAHSMKAQIQLLLAKYRGASVYITGHSLGGALATIAALDIKNTFNVPIKVYTFGQPRVGNGLYAKYFSAEIPDSYRVIHYADLVPHLPAIDMNFKHYEHQIWYTHDMQTYKECTAEDRSCSDSFSPVKLSTDDHDLNRFYMKLPIITQNLGRESST